MYQVVHCAKHADTLSAVDMETDFHGLTIEEAKQRIDSFVDQARMSSKSQDIEIITGNGPLKWAMIEYCRDCGLECSVSWNNGGVILLYIE